MRLECPNCGCKLGAIDIETHRRCFWCDLQFTEDIQPVVPSPAPLPKEVDSEDGKNLGCAWGVALIGPALAALLSLAIVKLPNGIDMVIFAAVATAFVSSIFVARNSKRGSNRVGTMLVAFLTSLFISAVILFGACMLALMNTKW